MNTNFNIEAFLDLRNYADKRTDRRKGSGGTNEFFTPYCLVKRMTDKVTEDMWYDPTKTFLEPSCGNGQFVCYIIYKRLMCNVSVIDTMNTVYAVDLMPDNIHELKERVFRLLNLMEVSYDKDTIKKIMDHNFVACDFFKFNFDEWREFTDDELIAIEKEQKRQKYLESKQRREQKKLEENKNKNKLF